MQTKPKNPNRNTQTLKYLFYIKNLELLVYFLLGDMLKSPCINIKRA